MKLSHKLVLVVILTSCFIALPVLYITYQNVTENALKVQEEHFSDHVESEFRIISESYLASLENKVNAVINLKGDLVKHSKNILADITAILLAQGIHADAKEKLISRIISNASVDGFPTVLVKENNAHLPETFKNFIESDVRDIRGRTFKQLLEKEKISQSGEYATFTFYVDEVEEHVLFYFLPIYTAHGEANLLVSYVFIHDFENSQSFSLQNIVKNVQKRFDQFLLYKESFILLLDNNNKALAQSGEVPNVQVPKAFLERAREKARLAEILTFNEQEYFLQTGYLEALGWTMIFAAPLDVLSEEGIAFIRRLLAYCLVIIFISLFVSLLLLNNIVSPLRDLTRKVKALRHIDLSQTDEIKKFTASLPVLRRDEIGVLANNFRHLSNELSAKINYLIEATAKKERLEGELNAARDIQLDILNSIHNAPQNDMLHTAFFLEPAKEVGGDLYEYFLLKNGKYAFAVGDVAGKGVASALFMSMTVTLIRYALYYGENLKSIMTNVNEMLASHNDSNMFVTLFIMIYDPKTGGIEYVNGGHCMPLIVSRNTKIVRKLEGLSGPVVGVFEGTDYCVYSDTLQKDELLLAYSDGVTEAMDKDYKLYSDTKLIDFMSKHADNNVSELIDNLYDSILEFRAGTEASDDITIFALSRK